MISVFGNEIVSAFTGGVPVTAIYTYGEKVWPTEEPGPIPPAPSGDYYIRWSPSDISGSFSIGGSTYNLEDYGGYFSMSTGVITSNAFMSLPLTTLETNVERVAASAFKYCSSLSYVSMTECTRIGSNAFRYLPSMTLTLSKCSLIGDYAFRRTESTPHNEMYMSVYGLNCSYYGHHCFLNRLFRTSGIDFTNCQYVGKYAFTTFAQEGTIGMWTDNPVYNFSKCSYIGSYAFTDCGMTRVRLFKVTFIGEYAFNYRDTYVENPVRNVSIYTNTVCEFGSNCFASVKRNGTSASIVPGWTIYVPSSLVSDYKTAYPFYSSRIYSITEPVYEISWESPYTNDYEFRMNGYTYNISDYGGGEGTFKFLESTITSSAFYDENEDVGHPFTSVYTNAKVIEEHAFAYAQYVCEYSLPDCEYVGSYAFDGNMFSSISLPECSYIGEMAFAHCYELTSIYIPKCSIIESYAFEQCDQLESVDLGSQITSLGEAVFRYCESLSAVVIRKSTVLVIDPDHDPFDTTPIYSGNGSIYVPQSLVSRYQSRSYWRKYWNQIRSIV